MHLSKNSRYVLQKAQFLPPFDFLKGVEKNLSVKIPKDDPTKPALRVNIPEDRPRSKSIGSTPQTPPIKAAFQESLLPTSENEIQFSKFSVDDILGENNLNPNSQSETVKLSTDAAASTSIEENDYNNELRTVLQEPTTAEALGNNYFEATEHEKNIGEQKAGELSTESEIDPKNLYIIIDVPGKRDEKRLRSPPDLKDKNSNLLQDKNYAFMRGVGQSLERKSKSLPRFSTFKRIPQKHMKSNFEIHEFDDASTYVFHLKLNKSHRGVLCVPERDLTTRRGEDKMEKMEGSITGGSEHPLRKQVTIVEDRPEAIRYDGKSSKFYSAEDYRRSSGVEEAMMEGDGSELQGRRRLKEDRVFFNAFVEDDFRSIRNGIKTYPFKMPNKRNEKKRDEDSTQDESPEDREILPEGSITTNDWWKKDPMEEAKISYETDLLKARSEIISSKEKNETVDAGQNEPPLPPLPPSSVPSVPPVPDPPQTPIHHPPKKNPEPMSPYFNISDVISDNPDYTIMNRNLSDTMYDTKDQWHQSPDRFKDRPPITDENGPKYFNIEEVIPEDKRHSMRRITDRKKKSKKSKQLNRYKRLVQQSETKQLTKEMSDFHTAANCLSIACEGGSSGFLPFGSAFPPLLSEALKNRFKFRKELLLTDRWNTFEDGLKGKSQKDCSLGENSILFPEKQSGDLECDNLFIDREEIVSNLIKSSDTQTQSATGNEATAAAAGSSPVDSLAVMKKVKEIVQFDLNNAVKIFNDGGGKLDKELSSVVMAKGEGIWEVDKPELKRHIEMRKNEMMLESVIRSPQDNSGGRTENKKGDESQMPLYLPSKAENSEMKLLDENMNSVVLFDSKTNEFFIKKEALAKAISERTEDSFGEVLSTLNVLAEENVMDAKSGDSILVYDVETKSWKVDFSILEKRQQQQQIEEELTKRSEAILETFERFEKEQFNAVPKPNSPEKKTFDYEKEQWKAYNSGKKNLTKSKLPFKKSNAEEIRKKNSDMYENLFDGKKKVATNNSSGNESNSDPSKESKLCSTKHTDSPGTGPSKGNVTPAQPVKSDTKTPLGKNKSNKEEDHFWETFLRIQIPPKPSKGPLMEPLKPPGMPKPKEPISQPKDPISQPKTAPPPTTLKVPKVDPEKTIVSDKKIEEPRFRIHLPFIRDKKIEKPKGESTPLDDKKVEEQRQPPIPAPQIEKKEEAPKVKAPPPPSSNTSKGDPPKGMPTKPPQTIGSPGSLDVPPAQKPTTDSPPSQKPSTDVPPSPSTIKIQDPKLPGGKNDKAASASEHYVSDKIIELTRSKNADHHSKVKANKVETVKLNITSDTRMPSKITEINLGKKSEEKVKEAIKKNQVEASASKTSTSASQTKIQPKAQHQAPAKAQSKTQTKTLTKAQTKTPTKAQGQLSKGDLKKLNKHLENFKTSFSDPDFEEKLMKIKSDLESNPNLKKLDNWSKTLVLHDIMKPPENLETWLKDETDKMATLLLKVLQEAGDAKTKKKQTKAKDKHLGKGSDRKKQKNSSDNYFFRVQTMNLAVGNDKKMKTEGAKVAGKAESMKELPIRPRKHESSSASLNSAKATNAPALDGESTPEHNKAKRSQTTLGCTADSLMYKDLANQVRFPMDITDDVPGPEILKKISNAWRVIPVLGSQLTVFSLHRLFQLVNLGTSVLGSAKYDGSRSQAFTKLFNKYGPIVNVQGPLSGNVIFLYKAEHLQAVFDQDTPIRSVFDSLEQGRKDLEERSSPTAISIEWNKPEWNDLRRGTNDPITKGWDMYFGCTKSAAESLVYVIRRNRNAQDLVSEDFMHEIKRWSLEGMCQVLFEKSFGYLEGRVNSDSWILEPEKLYMALIEATTYLNKCERGFQSWRLFTTPSLAGLADSYRSIFSVILKQLNQAEINLKNKNEVLKSGNFMNNMDLTFIESMLLNDGLTPDELICNLADTMLIGTNMMNSTMGFLLYNLAQNSQVQKKLFTELKEMLPTKNSQLDYYKLNSLKYLQACLKESLRLHPPIPIFYRLLQNDILVGNYIIPKGSYVVMDCGLSNMREQNFEDPSKFLPERWMEEDRLTYNPVMLAPFPFCHGPRGELIKKIVEMQLSAGIAKIIRNFAVEYHYEDIQGTDTFVSSPDKPLKLNFVEREC